MRFENDPFLLVLSFSDKQFIRDTGSVV